MSDESKLGRHGKIRSIVRFWFLNFSTFFHKHGFFLFVLSCRISSIGLAKSIYYLVALCNTYLVNIWVSVILGTIGGFSHLSLASLSLVVNGFLASSFCLIYSFILFSSLFFCDGLFRVVITTLLYSLFLEL